MKINAGPELCNYCNQFFKFCTERGCREAIANYEEQTGEAVPPEVYDEEQEDN